MFAALVAWPSASLADEAQGVRSPQAVRSTPSPKRAVPDYDGRGRPEARPDAAWWALRVPLAPAWLASERSGT
jgi:hypothetical protein